ncbi:hypothetical protein [Mycolicibacterium boenickei]|uniref:hypothetical protein n=1 Tax=Mycolicibacterium boenickei TaxID=146017 RepID=UPI001F281ECB|nr:hypothetical protein [Mycolicibacterium boenickei]
MVYPAKTSPAFNGMFEAYKPGQIEPGHALGRPDMREAALAREQSAEGPSPPRFFQCVRNPYEYGQHLLCGYLCVAYEFLAFYSTTTKLDTKSPRETQDSPIESRKGKPLSSGRLVGSIAVAAAAALSGLCSSAPAAAAPTGQTSAQATIAELEAQGFRVILNKVGNAPMDQCTVTAVRQGTDVKHSWVQRGPTGRVNNLVRYTTAYVDLMCTR